MPERFTGKHMPKQNVLVVCLEDFTSGRAPVVHALGITNALRQLGYDVELIAKSSEDNRVFGRRIIRYAAVTLMALKRMRRCDVIYFRSHPMAAPLVLIAKMFGKRMVQEVNGEIDDLRATYGITSIANRLLVALQHFQYRRANAIIAVTPRLCERVRRIKGVTAPISFVSNGVDSTLFHPGATGPRRPAGRYALFSGGMHAWHDIDVLIAAAAHPQWPADMVLAFAGDGPLSGRISKAAEASGGKIIALGRLSREDLAGVLAGATVVLISIIGLGGRDQYGAAPLKLFEALAAGRPVVVSDLPFQADVVRDEKCGLVVPSGDAAALADAVRQLADNREDAEIMGQHGRNAATQRYDWSVIGKDVAAVLERV